MTSFQIETIGALRQVIPGPWETFEQLSVDGYRLPLGPGTDLVVHSLGEGWTASFGEADSENEIELSSVAESPEEAATELTARSRRLTLLTCRSGDKPVTIDDFQDLMRSALFALFDAVLSGAKVEREHPGSWPNSSRGLRAEGS
jgi:hypothetical protein